jgi:Na+/H+ antiporter NhaC
MTIAAEALVWATIIALGAVTVYVVLEKNGAIDYLQAHATRIFGPFRALPSCASCCFFWLCFLLSIPLAIASNLFYLALALIAAPLSKAIYENNRARN